VANARKNSRHNQEKILFALMGCIIIGLIISGYFLFVKKILPELSGRNEAAQATSTPASGTSQVAASEEEFIPQEEAQALRIYFAKKGRDNLASELRKVRKRSMLIAQARQIVETVLEGPADQSLYQIIPKGTTLRGLFFDSGVFIVDLSHEFLAIQNQGIAEQILGVYSLVNSLTELDARAKVRFLINGTEPAGNEGHVDLSQPMTRLGELILES
jgi:spore germination protein GerM